MWRPIERLTRYAEAAYIDLRVFLAGKTDRNSPPLRLRFVGDGDFETAATATDLVLDTSSFTESFSSTSGAASEVGRARAPRPREVDYEGFASSWSDPLCAVGSPATSTSFPTRIGP